jgi:hypothetical protein
MSRAEARFCVGMHDVEMAWGETVTARWWDMAFRG